MNTLVCTTPGQFEYTRKDRPAPSPGHSIIRIKRIGVCGTDLHAYEGAQPFFSYPRILGHELAGILVDPGGSTGFEVGEAVTFIPYFNCGTCIACRNEKPNCCVSLKVFGVHIDGGMTEYVSVPSSSLIHGGGLSMDALALVEPLSIGAHGVRRAHVSAGEYVLVIGAGPIGLGAMELARIAGGVVIALDVNDRRLSFCKDRLNVAHIINATAANVEEQLAVITHGAMPTVVIDATGNLKAINLGFRYIAHGGRYVLIGLQKGDITFSHPEFHKREATLMSSRNATREDFEHVVASLKNGSIDPSAYITHRVPFDEVKDSFKHWLDPAFGAIKVLIEV